MLDQAREQQIQTIVDQLWEVLSYTPIEKLLGIAKEKNHNIKHHPNITTICSQISTLKTLLKNSIYKDLVNKEIPTDEQIKVIPHKDMKASDVSPNLYTLPEEAEEILSNITSLYRQLQDIIIYTPIPDSQ